MKTAFINRKSGLFTRPGIVAAAAVVCGYWASQILAVNSITTSEMENSSWSVGILFFGLFSGLFVLHLLRPWSKMAAILGLCSLAVFTGVMWYNTAPVMWLPFKSVPSVKLALLITTVLGVAGMALDARRCWHLARSRGQLYDYSI